MLNVLLQSDLRNIANEARRSDSELRDSVERALLKMRFLDSSDKQVKVISQSPEILKPLILSCERKNVKLATIGIGAINRLITHDAIHKNWVAKILAVLKNSLEYIDDPQTLIKILQCATALLTNRAVPIHDDELASCLLIQFKLHKIVALQSIASASLFQAIANIFENLKEKKTILQNGGGNGEIEKELSLYVIDAVRLLRDLCSMTLEEMPTWLQIEGISKNFAFETIESLLSNYAILFKQIPQLEDILRERICPMLVKIFRSKKQFPTMLRLLRVIVVLVHNFQDVILSYAEKLINRVIVLVEGDNPLWLKCFALEVIRQIISEDLLLLTLYETMDTPTRTTNTSTSTARKNPIEISSVSFVDAPSEISDPEDSVSERFSEKGIMDVARGPPKRNSSIRKSTDSVRMFDKIVNNVKRFLQNSLNEPEAPDHPIEGLVSNVRIQSLDFLSLQEAPEITHSLLVNIGVQCLLGIVDAIQSMVLKYNDKKLSESQFTLCKQMADSSWPAILAALSIALTKAQEEVVMQSVLKAYQTFTQTCNELKLITPREAFLTSLKKFAIPTNYRRKKSSKILGTNTQRVTIKNLQTMKRIINIAHQMGNELGEGWSIVLDCLEYLHILLHSGPAVIVSETDEEKEVVGKDELYVLSSSFSSLFTTSHVLSDQGLTVLVEHIDRRARLTLFPIVVEEQELLEQSSESHVKAHLLFGITKLGDIISANMDRIHVVWDLINDFLNLVCNHGNVFVRSEGVATLSRIAEAGLKKQDGQLQRSLLCTMKTLACSQYADVREMTLDEIYNILQSCGHRLSSGWPFVLSIVSVTINPNSKFECKPKHVAKSFNSLRYICSDFLGVLPLDTLAQLITTIGFYGKPMGDINVAITSISGLLWTVSDYLANDVNKREGVSESLKSSLWITLFGQLRIVSLCERHEIRTAALRAMFGILTTHGGVLKPSDWEQTLEILYEMLDGISVLAGEASTDENLQEHQLGQEEDGKPAMMLVHHSRNSAAKQWAETRVIALEGVLRIFQAFFSVLSRDLSDVSKCWKKIMSYIVIYWDSNDIEIALAGVKAVETMLIASSGVDQYPVELWDQGWTTYQKMVSNLTTKEQKVSPQTINIFSVSINNLYQKLKHRMRESDVNLFLSIICPLCSLPVQFAGELSPLRRTVLSIMLECSTQYPSLVPKVTSILLHYNSIAIGYPYNPKCFREPQEQPTVDSPPVTWDISADKLNKLFLPLAELSLKTMKQIWANLYSNQPLQTKIFGDLMHILGRIIQLKFVSYESTIWLEAIALFLMVMEEGTTIFVSNDSNLVELNVIWNDITDSIDSFLFHQSPNVATDMAQLSRDEHLDIFMCKALLLLLNQPTVVPNLRDRLVSTLIEGTNIKTEGREQVSRCCWSLLFSLINFPPPPLPRPHKLLTEKIPTSPKSGPLSGQFNKATPPVPDSPTKTTLITINSVAHLIAPKLIDLCQSVIRSFIADEKKGPIDRRRVSEVSFLLEQLSNLNLNPTIKLSSGTGGIALIKYLFPVLVECITSNEASVRTSLQKLFLLISNDICNNVQ